MVTPEPRAPTTPGPNVAPVVDAVRSFRAARDDWNAAFEREYLAALVAAHGGNIRAAAASAGIDRVYLYRLLWKHGLR